MVNPMNKIAILLVILILAGCETIVASTQVLKPMPWIFDQMPENGSEIYKQAWKDGCQSGLGGMSNDYYKTYYPFKQTHELLVNEVYYKTWKDTYTFCRHYAYGIIKEGSVRMTVPDQRSGMEDYIGEGIFNTIGNAGDHQSVFGSQGIIGDENNIFNPLSDELFSPKNNGAVTSPLGETNMLNPLGDGWKW